MHLDLSTALGAYHSTKMSVQETRVETFAIPNEWIYRGEGNCNIVISLPKSKQILRIRKTEKPKTIFGWILVLISDFFHWYHGKGFKEEIRDLNFYCKVMRPLIGKKYTSESKQVILSRKQVQVFRDGLIKKRPEFRQNKTLQYGRAALFDDFAFLPKEYDCLQFSDNTFSVEIKPKQGWRPLKEQMFPQCFFCMNQYLKLQNKLIASKTKYCPEELFSGDRHRMKTALKYLIEIPQNNLKIFKDGLPCFIEQHKIMEILQEMFETNNASEEVLTEEFCDFLQKCLSKDLENSEKSLSNSTICKNNDCCLKQANDIDKLPEGSVLGRILSVQKMDQEGTHSTYKKLMKNDTWEDFHFVDELLEILNEKRCDLCMRCAVLEAPKKYNNELIFLPYLISAIAKDCSLMITFRKLKRPPCGEYGDNVVETQFGAFMVNIGVFDLYPKPLSTIRKHYKRNKEIFKALKRFELVT